MKKSTCRKSGFTLVQVILILVVIALLAAIAIPNFVKARATSSKNSCPANLKQLDGAKQQWAVETKQAATAVPADSDLFGPNLYIRGKPICPHGGTYKLNAVSEVPTCSKSGAPDFHTF